MSSLHDPFDLLNTGQDMDNIVPFLAPNKVNQMIDNALQHPQVAAPKSANTNIWKFSGMAIAACLALFLTVLPEEPQMAVSLVATPQVSEISGDDISDINELVMLEMLERY